MGRHTADALVRLNVRVPRGQQAYWDIIRDMRTGITITAIERQCNVDRRVIGDYVRRLAKGGILEPIGLQGDAIVYRLTMDQADAPCVRRDGTLAVKPGRGQDRMWRTMKMLRDFTVAELSTAATLPDELVTVATAADYVKHLARAGYLATVRDARPGYKPGTGIPARYRLRPEMNTGPLAPQIQRTDWVFDPNRKQAIGPEVTK